MHQRRTSGKKAPPNRGPVLEQAWLDVIESLSAKHLIIGGKSMGGRIASAIADQAAVAGLICLGYPFHPTGNPDRLRIEHLQTIQTRTLILQGERDAFGNVDEVASYRLSPNIELHWLPDGDHSFKPRKSSGHTEQENWLAAVNAIAAFVA
jgi:predicted alpha/beta-hydrolase family hydrolase